ncbi:MAG: NAD(P)-binding domain-containing protein, partial [Saprospiraceae bacterium]
MQIGVVGLGKMGYNLALNLHKNFIQVVAYDINEETRKRLAHEGVSTYNTLKEMTESQTGRKIVWLMVPSGKIVDDTIGSLTSLLNKGDIIIDGGNSHYKDSVKRFKSLETNGID